MFSEVLVHSHLFFTEEKGAWSFSAHWSKAVRDTDPNLIFKKDHSGSTTNVAPHRGTPLRCFTTGQAVLFKILYTGVHKWCTHLRKRVFGQFNLRKRLPSVWHIVICSSTSCHLWKYQRKWVMALLRHPMLTFLRGFDNFFFPDIFSVTCRKKKPLCNSIKEIPDLGGLEHYLLKLCYCTLHSVSYASIPAWF